MTPLGGHVGTRHDARALKIMGCEPFLLKLLERTKAGDAIVLFARELESTFLLRNRILCAAFCCIRIAIDVRRGSCTVFSCASAARCLM